MAREGFAERLEVLRIRLALLLQRVRAVPAAADVTLEILPDPAGRPARRHPGLAEALLQEAEPGLSSVLSG